MKRIWFGAGLLALLLFLSIGCSNITEQTYLPPAEQLTRSAQLALEGNWNGARNDSEAARRSWERNRLLAAVLSEHSALDQIDSLFAQIQVFAATQEPNAYSSACMCLARLLEALGKSHSLNLHNLF